MGGWSRDELDRAFSHYKEAADEARRSGDWGRYIDDLFTDDLTYIEHEFGTFHGKQAARDWLTSVMSGFTEMTFPIDWEVLDADRGWVVFEAWNRLENPVPGGEPFQFASWTKLHYAGDNRWDYEEDIYNAKEAEQVLAAWLQAREAASS
jgi:hypothetical protein